jgi:DNA-binding response OmpR family regulator
MSQARKILIADPDLEAVRPLSKALRQKGYQVHYAPDGSRALEVSVLRHPDLVLIDEGCKLIDARTFSNILRTNPRTEDVPVVVTTDQLDADRLRGLRDGYLRKPFNLDEVLSRIEHVFRRSDAAKDLRGDSREIEGSLSQLSTPDLLQILAMNKRTGRMTLTHAGESGEILVAEGRPVNARVGRAEGEKAFFRLLSWTDGTFAFVPGPPPARARIHRSMDDALLEGMRQNDELKRLEAQLPPRQARVQLAPSAELSGDQHPVTAEVVELLRHPRALTDVLDLAPSNDLDVVAVLATLLQKGVARIVDDESDEGAGPLLGPAEIHALRSRLIRGRGNAKVVVSKIFLCASAPGAARGFLVQLPGLEIPSAEPEAVRSGFGTLGHVMVSEALQVDFCLLPAAEAARPLWRPFSAGAIGALLLDVQPDALRLASFLASDVRVPIGIIGDAVPAGLARAPAGVFSTRDGFSEALRRLLLQALHAPRGLDPSGLPDALGAI